MTNTTTASIPTATIAFTVPGQVYNDALDPRLETYSARLVEPYLVRVSKHGRGRRYNFAGVPPSVAADLAYDLDNIADCRLYGLGCSDDRALGRAIRDVVTRIREHLAPPSARSRP